MATIFNKIDTNKIKLFLEKKLKIRQNDWQYLTVLMPMFFVLMVAINSADVSTQTMLSQRVGTDVIPQMFFINAFLLAFVSIFLSSFVDKINKIKLLQYTLLLIFTIVISARILIYFSPVETENLSPYWQWLYKILFILTYATKSIFFLEFWLVAGEICDTRTAKRIYGFIGGGGMIGSIFSFFFVSGYLAKAWETPNLYYIWALGLGINVVLLEKMKKMGFGRKVVFRKKTGLKETIRQVTEGFSIVKDSTLLRLLAIAVVLYFSLSYTLDFAFLTEIRARFTEDSMASFIGIVKGLTFTLAFLFQILMTNRIIGKFGVHNSMMVEPISYTFWFTFILIALFTGMEIFIPVILAVGFRDLIFFSLHNPSYQIMYNPVSQKERGRARFFIDGLGSPTAQLLAAGLTWLLKTATESQTKYYMFFPLTMGIIFIVASLRLKKGFFEALVKDLGREELDVLSPLQSKGKVEGKAAQEALLQSLTDENPEQAKMAASIIADQGDPKLVPRLVAILKTVTNIEVQVAIINAIGKLSDHQSVPELVKYVDDDTKEIKLAALNALGSLKDQTAKNRVLSLMRESDDSGIRARSAAVLWNLENNKEAFDLLKTMLHDKVAQKRIAAAEALSEVENEEVAEDLLNAMDDRMSKVRYYSALALGRLQYAPAAYRLITALGDPSHDVRVAAQKALLSFDEEVVGYLMMKLQERNLDLDFQRRIIEILGQLSGESGETELIEMLISHDYISKRFVLDALAKREEIRDTEKLEQFILKQISSIYRNLSFISILEPHTDKKAGEMLKTLLIEENRDLKYQILQALGLIKHDSTTFDLVARKLRSPDSYLRANAIETLENVGHKELVQHIIPLVETPDNENLLERLKKIERGLGTNFFTVLFRLLENKNPLIRACSVYLVGELKSAGVRYPKRLMGRLTEFMKDDNEDPIVKQNAEFVVIPGQKERILGGDKLSQLEIIFLLKKVQMFANVGGEDLVEISKICSEQKVAQDHVIMEEAEEVRKLNLYILIEGVVQMSNKSYNPDTKETEDKITKILSGKKQDYFGDLEVFGEHKAAATYSTMMLPTQLLVIDGRKLRYHLAKNPRVALEISKVFSQKLRDMNDLLAKGY